MAGPETLTVLLRLQQLNAEKPESFFTRTGASRVFREIDEHRDTEKQLEASYIDRVCQVLEHPALDTLIDEGEVTFGMIKPNAYESKNMGIDESLPKPLKDDQAADVIRRQITREGEDGIGEIIFEVSLLLKPEHIDMLYPGLEEQIGTERYGVHKALMTGGPLTIFLLRHQVRDIPSGGIRRERKDAVRFWRDRMGRTNPDEETNPDTIRKKYALSINNNLVHGSDSPESAKREKAVFVKILRSYQSQAAQ